MAWAALAGCAAVKEMEQKGFTTEVLLELETADWGQPTGNWDWPTRAKDMNVPVDARPMAIRDLHCRREGGLYNCDYLIDYGRQGQIEGSFRKRNELIGKNDEGKWSLGWIVVT